METSWKYRHPPTLPTAECRLVDCIIPGQILTCMVSDSYLQLSVICFFIFNFKTQYVLHLDLSSCIVSYVTVMIVYVSQCVCACVCVCALRAHMRARICVTVCGCTCACMYMCHSMCVCDHSLPFGTLASQM